MALRWLRSHPSKWQTFVANRIAAIQEEFPDAVWHHIPGVDNPADCESREWPVSSFRFLDDPPKTRAVRLVRAETAEDHQPFLLRFLSLRRLLRVTAWCMRWSRRRAGQAFLVSGSTLSCAEVEEARRIWVLLVQRSAYSVEIGLLDKDQAIDRKSTSFGSARF